MFLLTPAPKVIEWLVITLYFIARGINENQGFRDCPRSHHMKKIFTAILIFLLFSLALAAPLSAFEFSAGLKAGLNRSSFWGKGSGAWDGLNRFTYGAFFNFGLSEIFSFQPEIFYATKGAGIIHVDYLEFPLLVKAAFPIPTKKVKTNLIIGYAPSVQYQRYPVENGHREPNTGDFGDHYDQGLVFGIGLDIRLGKYSILPEFRYSFGSTAVYGGGGDDPNAERNQVFSFLIGLGFSPIK